MKICSACQEPIKDDALRCKHCGTRLPVKKCPWCAEIIDEHAAKCKHCKSYLDKVRCAGCGKHAIVEEMRCAECTQDLLQESVSEEVAKTELKAKTQIMVLYVIILVLSGFVIFG